MHTLLESFQNVGPTVAAPGSILAVSSALHPLLTAGDNYWLVASPDGVGTNDWNQNSTSPLTVGREYQNVNGFASYFNGAFLPAFSVTGTAVPEPSSLILAGTAVLVAVGSWARRRSRLTNPKGR